MNVKIVVLGAVANMAQPALRYLVNLPPVSEIVLTDLNEKRLQKLSNELGKKTTYQLLNILDEDELTDSLQDAQLVMNFVGPYYRFNLTALKAAIHQGVHYIDLCDDYDVTVEALELNKLAEEKGVIAITGMGASPGITNLFARLGADQLDTVQEINTYWVVGDAKPSGFGALIHMFHIIAGKVPTFMDGKETWIRAFQQDTAKGIDFGGPVGEVTLYHVGHPEPVTLPRNIPNVQKVTNYGALLPEYQNPLFKTLVDVGLTSEETIDFKGEQVAPLEFLLSLFAAKQAENERSSKTERQSVSAVKIEVLGLKNGREASYTFTKSAFDKMDTGTSIPAAVVAEMLLAGEIATNGVLAPEQLEVKRVMNGLRDAGYFTTEKGFNVSRVVDGKETISSFKDDVTFAELW